jgi:hypothetical protein
VSEDTLARLEAIVDASGVATEIEARLPLGVRRRQLRVRTLLVGLLLTLADGRPAHLSRVHGALVALGAHDRRRLGICVEHRGAVHLLTYRQVEYTFSLVVRALGKEHPDGTPSGLLAQVVDALCEASVPALYKEASSSLAVDWSDQETFAFPTRAGAKSADPEATWGHRRGGPTRGELFFGYYFSAATMVSDEGAGQVPELVRRMALSSCAIDPVPLFVGVLERMSHDGVAFGDVLADSGYAHRLPEHWALPLRRLGAHLVMDLHPHDRGTRGTFGGAICFNGNLYCPSTPRALFELEPLARTADVAGTTAHDARSAELARYKLGRINGDDDDGYHRVMCPRRDGQGALPGPARVHGAQLGAPRDHQPSRPGAVMLHPKDADGPSRGQRQDGPKARLPLTGAPCLLCPAHRGRTRLRDDEGPGLDRREAGLVPSDGAVRHHHIAHLRCRRAQPADPRRLRGAPARGSAAPDGRTRAQDQETPTTDPR